MTKPKMPPLMPLPTEQMTLDRFLGEQLVIAQPRTGFRAGLDSVLLGAAINPQSTHIADLGAGVGTATCCALKLLPEMRATLVEKRADILEIAELNLKNNGLESRAKSICLDVSARGSERARAGLNSDCFTSVIANPPFFEAARGTVSPDIARAEARHMEKDQLDFWVKTAAACVAPRGEVIFIHLAQVLPQLLICFEKRFGAITVLPIAPRPGQPASRILVRAIKSSGAPLKLLPPLYLHQAQGHGFTMVAQAIFRGEKRLDW